MAAASVDTSCIGGALAWVPFCALGMALAMAGVAQVPSVRSHCASWLACQTAPPADARGNGMAILSSAGYNGIAALASTLAALSTTALASATGQLLAAAALAGAAAASWARHEPAARHPTAEAGRTSRLDQ